MRSRAGAVLTNIHKPKVVNMWSIGARDATLRRVWGCRVPSESLFDRLWVTFTKTAWNTNEQNVGRAHGSPHLCSDVLERFRGGAR